MVNITLYARGNLEDKSTLSSSKKGLPFLSSLGKKRIYLGTHLRATRVFSFPTGRVERGWLTLRKWLEDKSLLFTHFYHMQEKRIEAWFVSPASREYFRIKTITFLSTNCQKYTLW